METGANNYRDVALALGELQSEARKPVLLHSIYARQRREAFEALRDAGVPLFSSLEIAARAFRALVEHGKNRSRRPLAELEKTECRDGVLAPYASRAREEGRAVLLEPEAWAWLRDLGLPVPPHCWARTAEEAIAFATASTTPVALKLVSAAILHKSDVDGVRLGLDDASAVRSAFEALQEAAEERGADFRGALVVPMAGPGVDVAVGVARSDLGGHFLLFAAGGTGIEALDDVAVRPAPVSETDAAEMVEETLSGRLLRNPRSIAPPPLRPLYDLMMGLSRALAGSTLASAVDLNPVRVGEDGVAVLDARVILTS